MLCLQALPRPRASLRRRSPLLISALLRCDALASVKLTSLSTAASCFASTAQGHERDEAGLSLQEEVDGPEGLGHPLVRARRRRPPLVVQELEEVHPAERVTQHILLHRAPLRCRCAPARVLVDLTSPNLGNLIFEIISKARPLQLKALNVQDFNDWCVPRRWQRSELTPWLRQAEHVQQGDSVEHIYRQQYQARRAR